MRLFMNFAEATNEIRRDLKEMGHRVHPKSYQNKDISNDPNFATQELTNYVYMVINPMSTLEQLNITKPWADEEAKERFSGKRLNPGEAYKTRDDIWNEFLVHGKFDYSYPQRLNPVGLINTEKLGDKPEEIEVGMVDSIQLVADELAQNPDSRQCFIPLFDAMDLNNLGGKKRVPCTLGYQIQIRENMLHITYLQRSSDFATHFQNDVYLAIRLLEEIANRIEKQNGTRYQLGSFTHWIGSLHIYAKDVKNVF